jgi:hypothetical protein
MDQSQRLAVYKAQTTNVRELELAWSHTNKQINSLLITKQNKAVEITTKSLTLIYCALAESIFSKLIHTPYGLTLDEIVQVKKAANNDGVKYGWLKCAELSIRHIDGSKSGHKHNVRLRLTRLIDTYIFDPSLIRNKLAHGQWSVALNRKNDAVNNAITLEIKKHSIVELYKRKHALTSFSLIMEDIIESPNKAHHRDYWKHMTEMEETQHKLSSWTLQVKIDQLTKKKNFRPVKPGSSPDIQCDS